MIFAALIIGSVLASGSSGGVSIELASDTEVINPAKNVYLTMTLKVPRGMHLEQPDLRNRFVGFSVAEDLEETPEVASDGETTYVTTWRLKPEPMAETYKVKIFAVHDFIVGPIYFRPPVISPAAEGEIEVDLTKAREPFGMAMLGKILAVTVGACLVLGVLTMAGGYLLRKLREHRMSPIERAWVELERLLKKGLLGRGRYKDFYVELTLVVRRYIQRKYSINAPHLTTEEFLQMRPDDRLSEFLISADLIKFAGVKATPEIADSAVESARKYLKEDAQQ